MPHETSFQVINITSSNCENRNSELMRQYRPNGGVNHMWIQQNHEDMLEYIQSRSFSSRKNRFLYPLHNYFPH
jgi:hypothetical protein